MKLQQRNGVWYMRVRENGADTRVSLETKDRREAEKRARGKLEEFRAAQAAALTPKAPTLGAVAARALRTHYAKLPSRVTAERHLRAIYEALPETTPIDAIKPAQYDALVLHLRETGIVDATINRHLNTLCKVLRLAVDWELLAYVPKRPRFEEAEGRTKVYTDDEERDIVAEFERMGHPEMARLTEALIDTGIRLGEFIDRTSMAHDAKAASLHVWNTKNRGQRKLPLTPRANAALAQLLASAPLRKDQIEDRWEVMRANLGKTGEGGDGWVIHALRHTCCTRLAESGMSDFEVMKWMGHRDIKTTQRYTHLREGALRKGADALAQRTHALMEEVGQGVPAVPTGVPEL